MHKFQFWYEFASTYSYLSASRIDELSDVAGVEVEWKPFLLGPIFKSQGWDTSPFNIYPAKGRYMWRDLERLSSGYGIPFKKPGEFPRNGILASRIALIAADEGWCGEFSKLIFHMNFVEDKDISDEEVVVSALQSLGRDGRELILRAMSDRNRGRLRTQTAEAVGKGIFGAPSFVIGDEIFWGNDRLEAALEYYLSV